MKTSYYFKTEDKYTPAEWREIQRLITEHKAQEAEQIKKWDEAKLNERTERSEDTKEIAREMSKKYYDANKEKINEKKMEYRLLNKEKVKKQRQKYN